MSLWMLECIPDSQVLAAGRGSVYRVIEARSSGTDDSGSSNDGRETLLVHSAYTPPGGYTSSGSV